MKVKNFITILLLMTISLQTSLAQGFRVYKSDGTVAQFSLRTDSIVFYDGIGSDQDFGPFTPVNQCIVGTWYKTESWTMTFNEDGTTDYMEGATYEFMPYQGTIIIYNASGAPVSYLKVLKVTAEQMIVDTMDDNGLSVWTATKSDEHEWVDLGLPSGTLWATCNIGANNPEEYGNYFAWGETEPKDEYSWSTYMYCNGPYKLTKYCASSDFGYNGFTDTLTELLPEDDAATANWGSGWQMPSIDQIKELLNNTTTTWTTQNGVNGRLFTASNGNSIFLPAAGEMCYGSEDDYTGSTGTYWSRSLRMISSSHADKLNFYPDYIRVGNSTRYCGLSVRPVRVKTR